MKSSRNRKNQSQVILCQFFRVLCHTLSRLCLSVITLKSLACANYCDTVTRNFVSEEGQIFKISR